MRRSYRNRRVRLRDPERRACDIADHVALKANSLIWIEVWLDVYDRTILEFGWRL